MFDKNDLYYMQLALELAGRAELQNEVPVGCVIVFEDQVIGEGFNQPISTNDPTAHAEIVALRQAGRAIANYRLPRSKMYVTLEPCVMCIGAIINSRVSQLIYGASDSKGGACGSLLNIHGVKQINHHTHVKFGLLANESSTLLQRFFKTRR